MTISSEQREPVQAENDINESNKAVSGKLRSKYVALKILSLKVAALLDWDLDLFQKKLPLLIQVALFQDLFYITMDVNVEIPRVPEVNLDEASERALFTLIIYYRWAMSAVLHKSLNNKPLKQTFSHK